LLSYVGQNENWSDLYNLPGIKPPKKHSWIEYDWFNDNIVNNIRKELLRIPIVDVVDGSRISVWTEDDECQVYFPYADKDFIREKIWKLSKKMYPQFVPIREHIDHWNEIIWKDCYKFSMPELSEENSSYTGWLKKINRWTSSRKNLQLFKKPNRSLRPVRLEQNYCLKQS
jgi:hypothetical protein